MKKIIFRLLPAIIVPVLLGACNRTVTVQSGDLELAFNRSMYSRISSSSAASALEKEFNLSDYLETRQFTTGAFRLKDNSSVAVDDQFGKGTATILRGEFIEGDYLLLKEITVSVYDSLPGTAIYRVRYINNGKREMAVKRWVNNHYLLETDDTSKRFWSFQGSSTSARADWVLPVEPGFYQENFMGMNDSDYGGGIPVSDLWRKDAGIAIGSLSPVPQEISLPVNYDKYDLQLSLSLEKRYEDPLILQPGDTLNTTPTFVLVHKGDYFNALRRYSGLMQMNGMRFADSEDEAFEPIWCGWGYMRTFTTKEILGTLPKVKELGIKWAVIDDGYQIAEGDWNIDKKRFPRGDREMKEMVAAIHASGLKAKIWWAPLAADPGSRILREDPKVLLQNRSGAPQYITWWDSYYMSPAYSGTLDHTREVVKMFMDEWGFDGLKLDGQHMNAVPADYNWNRPLENPEESIEALPGFFREIYQTARAIKPHAVVENCPCGCCMSFYNMPFTNQVVASDPLSSWQIRLKGKTYKAIMPHTAYYGDHVELSDMHDDFASSFGIGAVLGTKFTWPADNPDVKESYLLTPEKEKIWKKWFTLYNNMMLSKGDYLGELYDIGWDRPETHVISKGDTLYYAFYADLFEGEITLKGLAGSMEYRLYDYFDGRDLGTVSGTSPMFQAKFEHFLLVEARPLEKVN